jgi:putative nucleotidyltransferase with HDIG domain
MNKKLLIVEDDIAFSKSILRLLQLKDYQVEIASSGIEAKENIVINSYDLVITDIKLPGLNGIELLHHINRTCKTPVVLMSGFSDIIDIKEAVEIGAENFLPKPFDKENLYEVVANAMSGKSISEQSKNTFLDFSKIDIENFVLGSQFTFPIYLKLNKEKFVKIANKGEDILYPQIERFIEKGVTSLYLKSCDYINFINRTNELKNIILKNDQISQQKKIEFTKKVLDIITQYEYQTILSKELFNYSYETLENIIILLSSSSNTYRILNHLSTNSPSLYAHCVATSLISIALCKKNGWHKQSTILSISTAALFHDIGKASWPNDLHHISSAKMTNEQLELHKDHVDKGVEILKKNGIENQVITQVIQEHHEQCDGKGFPNSLAKNQIFPPARVVSLADEFSKHYHGFAGYNKTTSTKLIIQFIRNQMDKFDDEQVSHLEKILDQ